MQSIKIIFMFYMFYLFYMDNQKEAGYRQEN